MSNKDRLNIVDEEDNIIGTETRENIHKQGLLHREVHVWFYTPDKKIVFQHRSKDKDTYPDMLDSTVGGHVELGDDYKSTAIKEMAEETGVKAKEDDLVFIEKTRGDSYDHTTGMKNSTFRSVYAYKYKGDIDDLEVEEGKALGFETWPIDKIINLNLTKGEKSKFIPDMLEEDILNIFKKIKNL